MKKNYIFIVISGVIGFGAGAFFSKKKIVQKAENTQSKNIDKNAVFFSLLNKWMQLKEEGVNLEQYFKKKGYKTIAIYGVSHLGNHLISELENSDIAIRYGIDRRAQSLYSNIPLVELKDEWENVDAVIVTAICDYENIKNEIKNKIGCPIISLEEIISEM